jgi:hypothetical protein
MKKILKYRVLAANSQKQLEIAVNAAIQEGWQPFGGVAIGGLDWLQAIIVYGEN